MCVHGVIVYDGEVRVMFVKSKFISAGFNPSIDDYVRA